MSTAKKSPARTTKSTRKAAAPATIASKATAKAARATSKAKASSKPKPAPEPTPAGTKQSQLISLLSSPAGATLEQMTTLTGWQPHSVRGVISGALRKRLQLNVTCVRGTDGVRVYRIGA